MGDAVESLPEPGGLFRGAVPRGFFTDTVDAIARDAARLAGIVNDAALAHAADVTSIPVDLLRLRAPELPIALGDLAETRDGWAMLALLFFAERTALPTEH